MKPKDFQHLLSRLALDIDTTTVEITYRDGRKFEGTIKKLHSGNQTKVTLTLGRVRKGENPSVPLDFNQIIRVVVIRDRGAPETYE